jgi:hypothetical protein
MTDILPNYWHRCSLTYGKEEARIIGAGPCVRLGNRDTDQWWLR